MEFSVKDFNKSTTLLAAILTIVSVVYGMIQDSKLLVFGLAAGGLYFLIYLFFWVVNRINDPYKFVITSSDLTIDLEDPEGRSATITKVNSVKAKKDNLTKISDFFLCDGKVDTKSIQVSPGAAVVSKKGGGYVIATNLDKPYHKGDTLKRSLVLKYQNAFTNKKEYWIVDPVHPIHGQKVKIKFPKDRPCLSYDIIRQEGMYEIPHKSLNSDKYVGEEGRTVLHVELPPMLDMNKKIVYRIDWHW